MYFFSCMRECMTLPHLTAKSTDRMNGLYSNPLSLSSYLIAQAYTQTHIKVQCNSELDVRNAMAKSFSCRLLAVHWPPQSQ